jgi:hypothetical protein
VEEARRGSLHQAKKVLPAVVSTWRRRRERRRAGAVWEETMG